LAAEGFRKRSLQGDPSESPMILSKWGLSRCQPIPTPVSYPVKDLPDTGIWAAEGFDPPDQRRQPIGDRLGLIFPRRNGQG